MNAPDLIQNIPLDKLVKSPKNVRRTPPSETAEAVARQLRQYDIPFIVSTGYGNDHLERMGFSEPAVAKPYRLDQLEKALASLVLRSG